MTEAYNRDCMEKQRRKSRGSKYPVRDRVICRQCARYLVNSELRATIWCDGCSRWLNATRRPYEQIKAVDPEKAKARLRSMKEYENEHKRDRAVALRQRMRLVNFNRVSNNNPVCENCGCDDLRLLEINHINGGGTQEREKGKASHKFAQDIYMGRRSVDDLNLLCKICNALHYLEMKFGKLPFEVKFNG